MKRKSFNPAQVPTAISLESVHIASPCHADWDKMRGDDRSRFCPSCAKNVYNLSAMTSVEAQSLLQEKEGHLCVRFFQREDGTMLTQDCPVGVAALKERSPSFALWAGVASLVLLAGALLSPTFLSSAHAQPEPQKGEAPAQTATPVADSPIFTMGDVGPIVRSTTAPTPESTATALPTAAPIAPLMGKPMMPRATPTPKTEVKGEVAATPQPTPRELPMIMGRIAAPRRVQPTPMPLMGAIVSPRPPQKPPTKPGKTKSRKHRSSNSS